MKKQNTSREDRTTKDPNNMAGKPVVAGTRIPMERVVAHLANNPDLTDLFAAYPGLTVEDVKACLRFALAALEGDNYRVRAGLKESAGALVGVDTEQLLADIRASREQRRSRNRPS